MFEYSQLSIGNHPLVLESIIAQQDDDTDEFIIDSRMTTHLFSESSSNDGHLISSENNTNNNYTCGFDQLKFLSKVGCELKQFIN